MNPRSQDGWTDAALTFDSWLLVSGGLNPMTDANDITRKRGVATLLKVIDKGATKRAA